MNKTALYIFTLACCLLPLVADAMPKNKIYVTPEHDKHDLHRHSPDFNIKLKCDSIQWFIEEPEQQNVRFAIKDHEHGQGDAVVLSNVTNNSITQLPTSRRSLYVADVEGVDKGFNIEVKCYKD